MAELRALERRRLPNSPAKLYQSASDRHPTTP
jgi:hypothetical protein